MSISVGIHWNYCVITETDLFEHAERLIQALLTLENTTPGPYEPNPFLLLDQPSAPRPWVRVDGPGDAENAPTRATACTLPPPPAPARSSWT